MQFTKCINILLLFLFVFIIKNINGLHRHRHYHHHANSRYRNDRELILTKTWLNFNRILAFIASTSVYGLLNEDGDVCYNDDFDFSTNTVRTTVPLAYEKLDDLVNDLNTFVNDPKCYISEECAKAWMNQANRVFCKLSEHGSFLSYQYETNVTDENDKLLQHFAPLAAKANKILYYNGKKFYASSSDSWDPKLRRMFFLTSQTDLSDPKVVSIVNELGAIFAKAKVCKPNSTICHNIEPGVTRIMSESRNYDELLWIWKGWYDATGPYMKSLYVQLVDYLNQAALAKGYNDASVDWIVEYETENFENLVDSLFEKIRPFYEQLHAHVRRRLRVLYKLDSKSKLIPIHLTGNLWGQSWDNIDDIVMPYPNEQQLNVTQKLLQNGYTPLKMFKESERFFTSMGLCNMTKTFWARSNIIKPTDNREFVCHASASEFCNNFDFRIKMCTEVTAEHFYIIHHEMGHIEYFMSYRNQPTIFRSGASSAFHEAIGDTIALSVLTRTHLKQINLIEDDSMSNETTINNLMTMALKKISFAPFGYLMDKWRWNVFRGVIKPDNYNQVWWKMVNEIQGLESPVERNEDQFDAGSKYHIGANVPYIRYFLGLFHQFQFYKGLCTLAGHTGPLHTCDFFGSVVAGEKLKEMLSLGSSEHWTYALHLLTGYKTVNADALFEYFQPLIDWLEAENAKYPDDPVGFN